MTDRCHLIQFTFVISLAVLTLFGCSNLNENKGSVTPSCKTIDLCIREIGKLEFNKYGISTEESSLAKKIASFGDEAIDPLLDLLNSENSTTLKVAGYALGQFDQIDPMHLPKIVSGVRKDIPWLVNALGKIKTDEAAQYALNFYLNASSSPHNQERNAVRAHGERALPFIIDEANCHPCSDTPPYLLIHIIGEMTDSVKHIAAEQIIAELGSKKLTFDARQSLISLFFLLGKPGKLAEDTLLEQKEHFPELEYVIDQALIGIHSKYSGQIYANSLQVAPDLLTLRDLSELGPVARDAGPTLVNLLSHPDYEIRLGSARAIGYLKYQEGASKIIPLMNDKSDVRLNWAAAVSLGMIGDVDSIEALEGVRKGHWYPAVRSAAKQAIEMIKSGKPYKSKFHESNFAFDFFSYENLDVPSCESVPLEPRPEPSSTKFTRHSAQDRLKELNYKSYIFSYGPADVEEQLKDDPDGIIDVNEYNMIELREEINQIPDIALKIDDGWLVGSDRGEWGGELVFIPNGGEAIKLLDANIEDIYDFGDHYIAVTGLAHLGMNNGVIYKIQRLEDEWYIDTWLHIPGAPKSSWFVETGELLINTYGAGSVLLSKAGDLRMAPCDKFEDDSY